MNVAIVGPRFSPSFDGVGDHASWVTDSLVRAGHDVVVFTESRDARPRCDVVRVDRWDANALRRIATYGKRRLDVALVEYTPFNFGARTVVPQAVAAALRLRDVRVGTFMHEGFYRPNGTNPMSPLRATVLGLRDAAIAIASDAVFAASDERAAAILEVAPFLRSRLRVVPIGANVEPLVTERWKMPNGPPYRMIAFGVVAPRRRIALAIAMIAAARRCGIPFELDVVGRVYDRAYRASCEAYAAKLGVGEAVRFKPELPPHAVTQAFLGAHVAFHGLFEGAISSSGSFLAALAHGVPILAVRTPRDEAMFERLALFTSEDSAEMLEDALRLIQSARFARALGDLARERYERDFAWDRIAERALEFTALRSRDPIRASA